MELTRKDFLKVSAITAVGLALSNPKMSLWALEPVEDINHPLAYYPSRNWEKV
jgi:hypothetical protein